MPLSLLLVLGCNLGTEAPCADQFVRNKNGSCSPAEDEAVVPTWEDTAAPAANTDTAEATEGLQPKELEPLDAPKLLRRLSLDLLGVLPTVDALNAVEANPNSIEGWIENALSDPRWEQRLVHILGRRWHTQVDEFQVLFEEYDNLYLDDSNEYLFERSAGEEPLRLLAHVAARDLPWTEVVTAEYTMANEVLASIWPIDHTGPGWQQSQYTDGRPAAGVLTTNGLWLRYYSLGTNYNRGRAAAISRLLICEDYLARPVSFAAFPSLADADATETALRTEPYCLGCHATLDPIAATLFGFQAVDTHNGDETALYHREREPLGPVILGVDAAWFGAPVTGLSALVQHIAEDERFHACAVKSFAESLWQRDSTLEDWTSMQTFRSAYDSGGQRIRPLVQAIVNSHPYRAGEADDPNSNTARLIMPDQWSSLIEDLSGFVWTWNGFDQLDNDTYGYRIMTGGVDGLQVTRPGDAPSVTGALVIQRLSEAAATELVNNSLASGTGMLGAVSITHQPGDPEWDATVDTLFWRILARRPDVDDRSALSGLWRSVQAEHGAEEAWVGLISALLRHPESVQY